MIILDLAFNVVQRTVLLLMQDFHLTPQSQHRETSFSALLKIKFKSIVRFLSITMTAVPVLIAVSAELSLGADSQSDIAARANQTWKITGRQLKEATGGIAPLSDAHMHRLLCELRETEVSEGSNLEFLVGIEHVSGGGADLLDPFTSKTFPHFARIAVFDRDNQFVQWLPETSDAEVSVIECPITSLKLGEMRGKYVNVVLKPTHPLSGQISAPLPPGDYKLQLIAACGLFMGGYFRDERPIKRDARYEAMANQEAVRSRIATLRVVRGVPPVVPLPEDDEGTLHVNVGVEEPVDEGARPLPKARAKLMLRNFSERDSVALIDPFLWMQYPYVDQKIRWKVRNVEHPERKHSLSFSLGRRPPLPSDFVILPPQGVAACRIGDIPSEAGRYEIEVDLSDGIVAEQEKVEIVKTGDPSMSFQLGGGDNRILRSDSITKCSFTVK